MLTRIHHSNPERMLALFGLEQATSSKLPCAWRSSGGAGGVCFDLEGDP